MEPKVSESFLQRDLFKLATRASRNGWQLKQEGLFIKVIIPQRHTARIFRLLLFCHGYPRHLISAEFMPDQFQPNTILWPDDKEQMFRVRSSGNGIPFICMAGLKTYIPESDQTTVPYSMGDINISNIITRIAHKIESPDCSFLEVHVK